MHVHATNREANQQTSKGTSRKEKHAKDKLGKGAKRGQTNM